MYVCTYVYIYIYIYRHTHTRDPVDSHIYYMFICIFVCHQFSIKTLLSRGFIKSKEELKQPKSNIHIHTSIPATTATAMEVGGWVWSVEVVKGGWQHGQR